MSCAGTKTQILPAGNVTYVVGPLATLIIVEAGDRPDCSAVQTFDGLTLREPFPEVAEARLTSSENPILGFVRVPMGYVPLGKLRLGVSRCRSVDVDGKPWPFSGRSELTWCELRIVDRLPVDVLDRVRPTRQEPLPGLDWLRSLPCDPILALRDYVTGWYGDIPPGNDESGDPDRTLPEALLAFYRAAAGRREVFGLHNEILTVDELEDEDDGRVLFGAENQGVFVMLIDPTEPDPTVWYEGLDADREREPLSGFLLQFLLFEASFSSPFHGFATVTAEQARRLVEPLHQVPLQPMRWPYDPTCHYVAPGLVVTTATCPDGSIEVYAGSRHRSALRPLRDPGFAWDRFGG